MGTTPQRALGWTIRLLAAAVIVAAGIVGRQRLAAMRQPPSRQEAPNPATVVAAVRVSKGTETVRLSGYGSVRAATRVPFAAEVRGPVMEVSPRLESGERVAAGELLFVIDARDYELARTQGLAGRAEIEAELARLRTERATLEKTLTWRQRQVALADAELKRVRSLREQGVTTAANEEAAEAPYVTAQERLTEANNRLALLDPRKQAQDAALERVDAVIALSELNIARCRVVAPFTARIETSRVDVGQYVTAGEPVLELSRDDGRELSVSLPAADVTRWLRFASKPPASPGWFRPLLPAEVRVVWEEDSTVSWEAVTTRVEAYDSLTRTVSVLVTVPPEAQAGTVPLVPGMFCRVEIPGRSVPDVCRLPRSARREEDMVFVVEAGRLARRRIEILHESGDELLVRNGLSDGDLVVTRPPITPVDGMAVRVEQDRHADE